LLIDFFFLFVERSVNLEGAGVDKTIVHPQFDKNNFIYVTTGILTISNIQFAHSVSVAKGSVFLLNGNGLLFIDNCIFLQEFDGYYEFPYVTIKNGSFNFDSVIFMNISVKDVSVIELYSPIFPYEKHIQYTDTFSNAFPLYSRVPIPSFINCTFSDIRLSSSSIVSFIFIDEDVRIATIKDSSFRNITHASSGSSKVFCSSSCLFFSYVGTEV
jgi:hypothetical protein